MTQEKKQEFTLKITQANKTQMITILYEMIIDYLNYALDEISVGQKSDGEKSLLKAQNCLDELIRSVNLYTDLGKMLHKIYIFSKKELIVSGANHSLHRIWRVKKNIKALPRQTSGYDPCKKDNCRWWKYPLYNPADT